MIPAHVCHSDAVLHDCDPSDLANADDQRFDAVLLAVTGYGNAYVKAWAGARPPSSRRVSALTLRAVNDIFAAFGAYRSRT